MGKFSFFFTSPQPFEGNEKMKKTKPFFNVDRQKRGFFFFFIVETVVVRMRNKSIFTSRSQSVFALRGLDEPHRIPLSF
jgi:hypothetical protein